ncbi:ankyrin repeat domain-containing protein 33B-like [Microtus pennsylvanicus]|uniref:ankyrin repeat domain-containing protein 33B-like n=1 Tax=Microtus pennsylvanicus TaxID=10058 RepID=UPI003F6D2872
MQDHFEDDALTFRAPQRTRWYTRLWPACLGHGCFGRKRRQFQLYLIGYDPVGHLQRAASVGDVALVQKFINGSEYHINESDRRRRTSLHYACAHNHPNVVAWLVSNDSTDINIQDDEGCTPLIKATQRDNVECVSILLKQGADPHIVDFGGDAALHHAVVQGNITIAGQLLKYKANIDAKTEYGVTPYKLALYGRQHQMAEFLIKNGAEAHLGMKPNRYSFFFLQS